MIHSRVTYFRKMLFLNKFYMRRKVALSSCFQIENKVAKKLIKIIGFKKDTTRFGTKVTNLVCLGMG